MRACKSWPIFFRWFSFRWLIFVDFIYLSCLGCDRRLGPGVRGAGGGLGTRFCWFMTVQCEVGGGTKKTMENGTKKNLEARLPTAPLGVEIMYELVIRLIEPSYT